MFLKKQFLPLKDFISIKYLYIILILDCTSKFRRSTPWVALYLIKLWC